MTGKRVTVAKRLPVDQVPPFDPVIAAGMKALRIGTATGHQQRLVFDWLRDQAAGLGAQSFRAGDPYATAFMDGRRFVGICMMILLEQRTDPHG